MSDPVAPNPPEGVTVTGPLLPCADSFRVYLNNPSLLNKIEYNLCLAWHNMSQYALDTGHWLWNEATRLWDELFNITASAGAAIGRVFGAVGNGIVTAGKWIGKTVGDAAQGLWNETKNFMNWVGDELGKLSSMAGWATVIFLGALTLGGIYLTEKVFDQGFSVSKSGVTVRGRKR